MEQLSKFDESFIKNYGENNDKGYILEVDVECLFNLHCDLPFLYERKKIKNARNLFVTYISNLVHNIVSNVIQFNQKASLKPYIDMNTKFRTEAKNDFEKDFF